MSYRVFHLRILFRLHLLALTSLLATHAGADNLSAPVSSIKWISPNSWPRFIDERGEGLYASIIEAVFTQDKVQVIRETAPWKRSLQQVRDGKADITGATAPDANYLQASEPVLEGCEKIFAKAGRAPEIDSYLKNHKGAWVNGYISSYPSIRREQLKGIEVKTRHQALQMMLSGRVDYYLDNETQMNQTLEEMEFPREQFSSRNFFCTRVYMAFSRTPRGEKIRAYYDARIVALRKSQVLQKIYDKWAFKLPSLDP